MDNSTDLSTSDEGDDTVEENTLEVGFYYFYIDTNGATGGTVDGKSYQYSSHTFSVSYDHDSETSASHTGGYIYLTCNLVKKGYKFVGWQVTNSGWIYGYGLSDSNYKSLLETELLNQIYWLFDYDGGDYCYGCVYDVYSDFSYLTSDSLGYSVGEEIYFAGYFGYSRGFDSGNPLFGYELEILEDGTPDYWTFIYDFFVEQGYDDDYCIELGYKSLDDYVEYFFEELIWDRYFESAEDLITTIGSPKLTFTALWEEDPNYVEIDAEYDSSNDYWYFEDGYMPQSVYGMDGQTAPSDVDTSAASEAYSIRLSTSSWAQVEIFNGSEEDYAYVTIYSDENVEVASAWFVVEPIVWIVAYGEDAPTAVTSAVTAQIVTAGYVYSNAGTSFSWAMSSILGMSVETLESYMGLTFASVGDFAYDSFSGSISQLAVTDDATTLNSKIAVSSVAEIDALGGSYASTCTDFVAFLLSGGTSTDGDSYSADYWTRDLAATLDDSSTYCTEFDLDSYTSVVQLNNGVYVTKDGTLSNAKLSTLFGARLTMSI